MRRPALARPPRCERPRGPPALTDGPPPETAEYEEDSGARGCVGRARKRRASTVDGSQRRGCAALQAGKIPSPGRGARR